MRLFDKNYNYVKKALQREAEEERKHWLIEKQNQENKERRQLEMTKEQYGQQARAVGISKRPNETDWDLRQRMQLQQRFLPEIRDEMAFVSQEIPMIKKPPKVDKLKELGITDESI